MEQFLIKYDLDKPLDIFLDNINNNNLCSIDCDFVEFIIEKTQSHIKYLDAYYTYFNKLDIHIIKNTINNRGVKLIDYYYNINLDILDESVKKHVQTFLQSYEMSNNIMKLFDINHTEEVNVDNSLEDEIFKMKQDINILRKDIENILKTKDDINILKEDIDNIKTFLSKKNNKNDMRIII